jgi:geranylgeranyl pyrophosphate synthase
MTQPVRWVEDVPDSSERTVPNPEESALVQLIRAEFAEPRLEAALDLGAERLPARLWEESLSGPLLELFGRPGKEFRCRLVEVAYELGKGEDASGPMPPALSLIVEVLHAGSLIIDDIEDGSQRRRGKPALHLMVGTPLALNAGNWLYFLPHSILEQLALEPRVELELRRAIDRGVLRCHYGQALDLGVKLGALAQREVHDVVSLSTRLKTGSLLELAADIGSTAAAAAPELQRALRDFGRTYGVALQMLDDTSGLYEQRRQEKGYEDLTNARPTWPWAWLSRQLDEVSYSRLQHRAREVERGELHPEALAEALRKHLGGSPYRAIHQTLNKALAALERHVGSRRALDPLAQEIDRLEQAYA